MMLEEESLGFEGGDKIADWIDRASPQREERPLPKKQKQQPERTKERLARTCTTRLRIEPLATVPVSTSRERRLREEQPQCRAVMTFYRPVPPSQEKRWELRSMWEFASVLNFLHIFRPLLNINAEFSAEELETALITPNSTLDDVHMPLLKAIPPITRMALGRATWVTVLCRKLRDWWHWVAEGEIPIVASHGTEVDIYKTLEPATRILILKALCDIRVEQEDIRNYIDDSIKHGVQLSAFRRERIGGDAYGTHYWYEDDPVIGHRLHREIRKIETKKFKQKGLPTIPIITCQWETVATNLDEFEEVSDKLVSSKNRTESALGKKLKIDMLPEIEKIHKRKERALKKQHRQALLLDSYVPTDGLTGGRSLRDRKPVTYTFDDFDRSISEAIKITKKRHSSPETTERKEPNLEVSANGRIYGPARVTRHTPMVMDTEYPKSDYDDSDGEQKYGPLDRSDRRRQRPQRYSVKDFVEAVSDNDADFDSDEDIVGEAVYDEEYLRNRKHKKAVSSSEGDEEYHWEEENGEDDEEFVGEAEEEEEDEEDEDSMSGSEEMGRTRKKLKTLRSSRSTKLRSVDEIGSGLRRSKRAARNRINYKQYDVTDSEAESTKPEKPNTSDRQSDAEADADADASYSVDYSNATDDSKEDEDKEEEAAVTAPMAADEFEEDHDPPGNQEPAAIDATPELPSNTVNTNQHNEDVNGEEPRKMRFLDLNEIAGFDDGPSSMRDDEDDRF